jgi:TRAP-type transport system small permease protein
MTSQHPTNLPSGAASPDLPDTDGAGSRRVAAQMASLPGPWRLVDHGIVRSTEITLCAIGVLFTAMVTLEVISRYAFSFSIFSVNAAARLLLVWFFLLGAGIALRHGAHVGFELLLSALRPRARRAVVLFGLLLVAVFCLEMVWGGLNALGPAWSQTEAGLDISLVWPVLAIPVGFALLLYHVLVIMWAEIHQGPAEGGSA